MEGGRFGRAVGEAELIRNSAKEIGYDLIAFEAFRANDTDFRPQLTSIKGARPQAIFIPGYYNDIGNIARQAQSLKIAVPLIGGDGWDHPDIWKLSGGAIEGGYFSTHFSAEDKSPIVRKFVETYRARFGELPNGLSACGYDAAKIACDAISRAGSADPQAIRKALEETRDFQGVSGRITIDREHNALKPAVVLQVSKGEFRYLVTVNP